MNLNDKIMEEVFTEVEGGINGKLNKLTVKCFDSINNNFSMDCDGNLVVNSITTRIQKEEESNNSLTFDQIYPVGSIYLSMNNVNPGTIFGGTWQQISQGRTLVGVDPYQSEFNAPNLTGGEKSHVLSINEMPAHNHAEGDYGAGKKVGLWYVELSGDGFALNLGGSGYRYPIADPTTQGANWAHNNLQPYFTCYMWTRIA